jgi:lipid II:glycine glycyltransferase (peptidoglycan interpeptide bridge formation enzyme)
MSLFKGLIHSYWADMMQSNDLIKEQVLQLKIEIALLEAEANKLQIMISEKKYALNRLSELLEIRGVALNDDNGHI